MKAIINTKLILEDSIIWNGAITYDEGRIVQVGRAEEVEIPADAEIIDAGGLYTAPGLVDIHNHGSQSALFALEPEKCLAHFISHGQTTVLPTFYCNLTLEQMLDGAARVRALSKAGIGRIMNGLYMEGPYMSGFGSNQRSILWGGDIPREEYAPLVDAVGDMVRIWAIDPQRKNIEGFMAYVKEQNPQAIFALGHSVATAEECRRVERYGVKVQTHHGNAGQAKGKAQGCIGAGCDDYTLSHADMYAELICDQEGVHLQSEKLRTVVRAKGLERVILITDSMAGEGDYTNNEADGIAYGPDLNYDYEGHLAGSHLTLNDACRNMMAHTGYGLCHVIRFASINPARLLGIDHEVGSLASGKKANLIIIDDTVRIKKVILEGDLAVDDGKVVMQ